MFPGIFGVEQLCSRRGGDSGPWVIPGRDSAPTKCSPQRQVSGEGKNITGTCGVELLFLHEGRRIRPDHSSPLPPSLWYGWNLPGSSGVELLFLSPKGGNSGHPRQELRPPEFFLGNL